MSAVDGEGIEDLIISEIKGCKLTVKDVIYCGKFLFEADGSKRQNKDSFKRWRRVL